MIFLLRRATSCILMLPNFPGPHHLITYEIKRQVGRQKRIEKNNREETRRNEREGRNFSAFRICGGSLKTCTLQDKIWRQITKCTHIQLKKFSKAIFPLKNLVILR